MQAQIAMKLQQMQQQLQLPIAADEHREQNVDIRWDIIVLKDLPKKKKPNK